MTIAELDLADGHDLNDGGSRDCAARRAIDAGPVSA
jgi:hypothetical protein